MNGNGVNQVTSITWIKDTVVDVSQLGTVTPEQAKLFEVFHITFTDEYAAVEDRVNTSISLVELFELGEEFTVTVKNGVVYISK